MSAITAKEAAAVLGLSARKLYELAASGQMACYRFGGAVRFDRADLETYKASCRSPATTPANGSISLTASLPGSGSALTAYFRKAGVKSRPTNSTGLSQPGSLPLQLVSQSPNR